MNQNNNDEGVYAEFLAKSLKNKKRREALMKDLTREESPQQLEECPFCDNSYKRLLGHLATNTNCRQKNKEALLAAAGAHRHRDRLSASPEHSTSVSDDEVFHHVLNHNHPATWDNLNAGSTANFQLGHETHEDHQQNYWDQAGGNFPLAHMWQPNSAASMLPKSFTSPPPVGTHQHLGTGLLPYQGFTHEHSDQSTTGLGFSHQAFHPGVLQTPADLNYVPGFPQGEGHGAQHQDYTSLPFSFSPYGHQSGQNFDAPVGNPLLGDQALATQDEYLALGQNYENGGSSHPEDRGTYHHLGRGTHHWRCRERAGRKSAMMIGNPLTK
ncbi:hypothetical protein T439DRAFT_362937 [Meredithblackwellia eburnea MCA 4105]